MVNEKVTNLRVINFFSLFLFYHQHFWDLFWSFRDAYQPSRWYLEGIKDLLVFLCVVESPVKKLNRKCLWREINPIVQGSFHWHDVRPEKKVVRIVSWDCPKNTTDTKKISAWAVTVCHRHSSCAFKPPSFAPDFQNFVLELYCSFFGV